MDRRWFCKEMMNQIIELHQDPHSWGFLFVGWWLDLIKENIMRKYLLPILLIGFWGCEDSEPEETLPNPVTLRDIIIDDSTFTISWSIK